MVYENINTFKRINMLKNKLQDTCKNNILLYNNIKLNILNNINY